MILITITNTGPTPRSMLKYRRQAQKSAYHAMGVEWHKDYSALHFTKKGATRYGYAPRQGESGSGARFKGSYTARKLKAFGHTLPLVKSGLSRALARIQVVKSTSNGIKVRIKAPRLNRPHAKRKINMRAEMTRVVALEANQLARHGSAAATKFFNEIKDVEVIRA